MDKQPLLSIVVPVYNGEIYIEDTLKYILDSSYKNLEVVVIIDGATDASGDICKKIAADDSRVRVYIQENAGIAAARNKGVSLSTGSYIGFCDQDDIVDKDMYISMIEKMLIDENDLCLCGTLKYDDKGKSAIFDKYNDDVLEKEEIDNKLLVSLLSPEFENSYEGGEIIISPCIWKCVVKKDVLEKHNIMFRKFVSFEDDFLFMIELLCAVNRVSTIKECYYKWRINFNSESHKEKYVEDIGQKQSLMVDYVCKVLEKSDVSEKIINLFLNSIYLINIVKIYENLASPECPMSWHEKKEYIKKTVADKYQKTKFKSSMLRKGYFRYQMILFAVEKKHLICAYFINIALKKTANLLYKMHIGAMVESIIKKQKM